ncbi:MAG TPA: hypothetical protein VNA66_03195 [Gammaproteobacteria bacterium]|nr:hypothetical protein [Gammaproteobacteria bacterium]
MSVIAVVVFVCLAGAVAFGMTMSQRLAAHHLSSESRDTVKLALGLVATLAALLLGLLVSSAKGTFDAEREQVNALAAKIATLDRVLTLYGAEAAGARGELRVIIESAIAEIWPTSDGRRSDLSFDPQRGEAIFRSIASLNPANPLQSDLKARATGLAFELIEGRSMFVALAAGGISVPVLTLVIAWLVVILFGFSIMAPRNALTGTALIISAAAVCGAVLLLLELYTPFNGVIQISSEPLLAALGQRVN